MASPRPPLVLRLLIGASLACAVLPAGFGAWSLRDWAGRWIGEPMEGRRADFRQVPWLREPFPGLARFLVETLPPDARVLVEPVTEPGAPQLQALAPPRWHVFLTHYAYPVRLYVRAPALSCVGFNHGAWLDHHFEVLDLDGSSGGPVADPEFDAALERAGIAWRLRMPVLGAGPELFGLDRREGDRWVEVPYPGRRP